MSSSVPRADMTADELLQLCGFSRLLADTLDAALVPLDGSISVSGGSATFDNSTVTITNAASAAVGPELNFVGHSGSWATGVDVANATTSRDFVAVAQRGTYSFDDGVTTLGSPTLTSAAQGGFCSAIVGLAISGTGIPAGTTIAAVGSANSLTMSHNATASGSSLHVTVTSSTTTDLVYMKHRGGLPATLGIGVTPPSGAYRLQVSGADAEVAMGGLGVRIGPSQTGHAIAAYDSNGTPKWWVDKDARLGGSSPSGGALDVVADAAYERPIVMLDSTKSAAYGWTFPGGGVIRFRYHTGGASCLQFGTDGSTYLYGPVTLAGNLGFHGATPTAKPTITGSRGGNAALANLLTALATMGLITDSTT